MIKSSFHNLIGQASSYRLWLIRGKHPFQEKTTTRRAFFLFCRLPPEAAVRHAGHTYLDHSILSRPSNCRTDQT